MIRFLAGAPPHGACICFAMAYTLRYKAEAPMRDLDKALSDIFTIRNQIAAGTAFRGYGPATIAGTGGLALITATGQFLWLDDPTGSPLTFFGGWVATALVSAVMIGIEMQARSRRHHSGLADAM